MQLFRVKDCKQMGKKKADWISPLGSVSHLFYTISKFVPIRYAVGGLALIVNLSCSLGLCRGAAFTILG